MPVFTKVERKLLCADKTLIPNPYAPKLRSPTIKPFPNSGLCIHELIQAFQIALLPVPLSIDSMERPGKIIFIISSEYKSYIIYNK